MTSNRVYRVQAVSSVADGALLTTVVLYFSQVVGLAENAIGVVLAVAASVALALAAPLGRLADTVGLRRMAVVYSLALAAALAVYTFAHSLWTYAAAAIVFTVARAGVAATIQAVVAAQHTPADRVMARARLQSLLNAGFGIGSVVGAVVLAVNKPALFVLVFAGAAAAALTCARMFRKVPVERVAPARRPLRSSALHDRRLVTVTALTSVLLLTTPILSVLLPLWLLTRSSAPGWVAAVAFGLNTLLVFALQSPWSARVRTDASASRSALLAGAAIGVACVVFALMPYGGPVTATVLALVGVAVLTVGEVATGPAAWHLALRDTPADRQGEYQSVFGMCFSVARITGPLLALPLITALGSAGWLVVAAAVLAAAGGLALVGTPITRRSRVGELTPA
ncbi:MFS transporter [Labedaea rhizosphaerae]|uniref:MFS transporter n=1 Tax=Labedaea rhizosphaerae TaxID=598644 RepID=A0A4R6RUF1_LABRH|nr:MFS transporter [Labedaea rhizosphaerae]TDP89895.1 MFS transporter [Labedaea rhizosphaerae]